jgi:hypothetical protein
MMAGGALICGLPQLGLPRLFAITRQLSSFALRSVALRLGAGFQVAGRVPCRTLGKDRTYRARLPVPVQEYGREACGEYSWRVQPSCSEKAETSFLTSETAQVSQGSLLSETHPFIIRFRHNKNWSMLTSREEKAGRPATCLASRDAGACALPAHKTEARHQNNGCSLHHDPLTLQDTPAPEAAAEHCAPPLSHPPASGYSKLVTSLPSPRLASLPPLP